VALAPITRHSGIVIGISSKVNICKALPRCCRETISFRFHDQKAETANVKGTNTNGRRSPRAELGCHTIPDMARACVHCPLGNNRR
jgi:hypothetical protein